MCEDRNHIYNLIDNMLLYEGSYAILHDKGA